MTDRSGDRLYFDQALRDIQVIYKETPWDVARTLAILLDHVWIEKHDPHECSICAQAEVYTRVLRGRLQLEDRGGS